MSDTCDAQGAQQTPCQTGLLDCCWLQSNPVGSMLLQCAQYNGLFKEPGELTWVTVTALATMALMAFGIGANDAGVPVCLHGNNW